MKAQEVITKGELFHVQNPIRVGFLTSLPIVTIRVNDFWVEYQNNRIHQFYSNLSLLTPKGEEQLEKTISVNNPLRSHQLDFYQSDWNLIGVRILNTQLEVSKKPFITQLPLFSFQKSPKSWITWINSLESNNKLFREEITNSEKKFIPQKKIFEVKSEENRILVLDQFQNVFFVYDEFGNFLFIKNVGDSLTSELKIVEILPSTGLLVKYDPSIGIIYFGFGLLMITACLSYLPYTQFWIFNQSNYAWVGATTNRGKIQLEIEFENFIRSIENKGKQSFS